MRDIHGSQQSPAGTAHPLIVRFGALGDMVMLLSLVHALHRRFGTPVDIVSSGSCSRALLRNQPGVGELYWVRSRKTPFWLSPDQWRLVRTLRARGFTPTWNCDDNDLTRALLAHAGIPDSCIVDAGCQAQPGAEHEVDRLLRLAALTPRACPAALTSKWLDASLRIPPLQIAQEQRRDLESWLSRQGLQDRPLVLIQAGNKRTTKWWRPRDRESNTKHWPEHEWAAVIDAVAASEVQAEFLLCGVAAEWALNRSILRAVRTRRVRNVAGDLPLGRLLALQERALGMISVDTGPAHSAGALGCPLVVLFGCADPSTYLPRSKTGAVIGVRGEQDGQPQMRAIRPEHVIAAWQQLPRRTGMQRPDVAGGVRIGGTAHRGPLRQGAQA